MHAVVRLYYLSRRLYLRGIPILPQLIYKFIRVVFACDVKYTEDIGNNARIGANAVVINDVAENTTVVGIPATPINKSVSL